MSGFSIHLKINSTLRSRWLASSEVFSQVLSGGGGYLTKFNTGGLCPEVQPFSLKYTNLAEKFPLLYTFYWAKVPLSHTCFTILHPLSKPLTCNGVNEQYQALPEEMLSKRKVLFIQLTLWNNRFPYVPFYTPQLVNPYPFIYLKPVKDDPFEGSFSV